MCLCILNSVTPQPKLQVRRRHSGLEASSEWVVEIWPFNFHDDFQSIQPKLRKQHKTLTSTQSTLHDKKHTIAPTNTTHV